MSDKRQNPMGARGSYVSRRNRRKKGERPPEDKAATFRIGEETIERVDKAAKYYHVQKGDFVRFLLNYALDQLKDGAVELPISEPEVPPRKLD